MLINGILYNSEAWQNITEDEYKLLEEVDTYFLRRLLGAHSKTTTAFLHLETGTLPIRFIVANRRLVYYYNIMSRNNGELIQRVFQSQAEKPTKGDWFHTITEDFMMIKEDMAEYDMDSIRNMQFNAYKKFIKKKIQEAAFNYLEAEKSSRSKVMNIKYKKLATQKYIKSNQFTNQEVYLLSRLRSRNIAVKDNFSGMYPDTLCSLGCLETESQQHLLECKPLVEKSNLKSVIGSMQYSDIFGPEKRQKIAVLVYSELLKVREEILNK